MHYHYGKKPEPASESDSEWDSVSEMSAPGGDPASKFNTQVPRKQATADMRNSANGYGDRELRMEEEDEPEYENDGRKRKAARTRDQNSNGRSRTTQDSAPSERQSHRSPDGENHGYVADEADVYATIKTKDEKPPYNFGDALPDATVASSGNSQPTGKSRKGNRYDPQEGGGQTKSEWNDSDEEERTLAELRAGIEQSKQQSKGGLAHQPLPPPQPPQPAQQDAAPGGSSSSSAAHWDRNITPRSPRDSAQKKSVNWESGVEGQTGVVHVGVDMSAPAILRKPHYEVPAGPPRASLHRMSYGPLDPDNLVYPFEEGDRHYLLAKEHENEAILPGIADKVDKIIQRIWQEFFAGLRIVISIVMFLILEAVRFVVRDIFYGFIVRLLIVIGDFGVKPLASVLFNRFVQPIFILLWNCLIALRDALAPLIDIIAALFQQVAVVLSAFRLVQITWRVSAQSTKSNIATRHHPPIQQV